MASTANRGVDLSFIAKPSLIKTVVLKLPVFNPDHNLAVGFEGLDAIKIEQARTGDVLTPTEYGNRFSGLDIESAKP